MDVFDLVAKISVDTSEYEKGLDNASKDSKSFGSKIAGGLGTAAKVGAAALTAVTGASVALGKSLLNNANEVAGYGDNIDKMSQKMGISAQAYQEWDAILQHSGSSIDSMSRGMQTLQKNAVNSTKKFKELGITEEQIAKMSTEELFSATIKGLQEMGEGAERTALASELLGGSAKELGALLNTSAEETEAMRQRVHELGGVMSDDAVKASAKFKDNLQDLQTAISGIKKGLTSEFLPAVSDLMEGFTKLLAGEEGAEAALDKGMDKLGEAIDKVVPKIGNLLETLLPRIITIGGQIVSKLAEQLPKVITAVAKQIPSLIKTLVIAIGKAAPELIKAGVGLITDIAEGMGNGDDSIIDAILEALNAIWDAISQNYDKLIDAGMKILEKLIDGILENLPKLAEMAFVMLERLGTAIIEKLPEILEKGKEILLKLVQGIRENLPKLVQAAVELIKKLAKTLIENLPEILQAGVQLILELAKGIFEALPDLLAQIPQIIIDLVSALLDPENIAKILDAGFQMIGSLFDGLFSGDFGETAGKIIEALLGAVLAIPGIIMDIGAKIVGFILEGIKQAWNGVVNFVESGIEALMGDVNKARDEALAALKVEQDAQYELTMKNRQKYYGTTDDNEVNKIRSDYKSSGMADSGVGLKTYAQTVQTANHYVSLYMGSEKVDTVVYNAQARTAMQNGGH